MTAQYLLLVYAYYLVLYFSVFMQTLAKRSSCFRGFQNLKKRKIVALVFHPFYHCTLHFTVSVEF